MCQSSNHVCTLKQKRSRHAPQRVHTSLMLYYGQNMHQVMEYHEHFYLVSLLFAAPFLLFIIFSKFFSTCNIKVLCKFLIEWPFSTSKVFCTLVGR